VKVRDLMEMLRSWPREAELYIAQPIDLEGGICYIPFEANVVKVLAKKDREGYSPVKGPVANAEEIPVIERKPGRPF
jgi:hypothetical protein